MNGVGSSSPAGRRWTLVRACAVLLPATIAAAAPLQPADYTTAQAERGHAAYVADCQNCHGDQLFNGKFGPALKGPVFGDKFGGKGIDQLFEVLSRTMPVAKPGSLDPATYADLTAFILQANGVPAGTRELPADADVLATMKIPGGEFMGVSPFATAPPAVRVPDRFAHWTTITEQQLQQPPPGDWLSWRRTPDAQGFSPLQRIDRRNVRRLQLAWSWPLPPGPNLAAPLVHDGVLFVHGLGDIVEALDARSGELLWHYDRRLDMATLPSGVSSAIKRGMALFGDRLYVGTSDVHVIALDVRSGKLVWDRQVGELHARATLTSGPLIAAGRVIVGIAGTGPGTAQPQVVGMNADNGEIAWRVHTIAQPGEPGGESWNGVPAALRSGASIWSPGSYDPATGLVYFGTGNTYDTGPLLHASGNPGESSDALYTESTLAIDARTGRLAWAYQHLPNDQWDMDWAFEQQVITLPLNGSPRRLVVTAGKPAIYDAVDAATGAFAFAIDLGLQNIITSIDPRTGAKTIDPAQLPDGTHTKVICPDAAGAKSFMPGSYDAAAQRLFVPLEEACMDMYPAPPGGGSLTSGVSLGIRAAPGSDGNYGRLEALSLRTRKPLWVVRQRAPMTSGVLATAGGIVFSGSLDRYFHAYDADSGALLWQTRLNEASSSSPITYEVDGVQYVAIVTGRSTFQAVSFDPLLPELQQPRLRSAAVWVFRLPE